MQKKYSRQREMLISELSSRKDHPTADEIYASLRERLPNISLGTVYRNLSMLSASGTIRRIECEGADRFDAFTHGHYHFKCRVCGHVLDVESGVCKELIDAAQKTGVGIVEEHSVMFYGVCAHCSKDSSAHIDISN